MALPRDTSSPGEIAAAFRALGVDVLPRDVSSPRKLAALFNARGLTILPRDVSSERGVMAAFAALAVDSYDDLILATDDLRSYWPLDDHQGEDLGPDGFDWTTKLGEPEWEGQDGYLLLPLGAAVTVGDNLHLDGRHAAFTFETWVKVPEEVEEGSAPGFVEWLIKDFWETDGDKGYYLYGDPFGGSYYSYEIAGFGTIVSGYQTNKWQYVAIVFDAAGGLTADDGVTTDAMLTMFGPDGTTTGAFGSGDPETDTLPTDDGTNDVYLGANTVDDPWPVALARMAFYDRALSPVEIGARVALGPPGPDSPPPPPPASGPNVAVWTSDWHIVSNDAESGGSGGEGAGETHPSDAAALTAYIRDQVEPALVIDTGDCRDHHGAGDELDQYIANVRDEMPWGEVDNAPNALYPILPGNHDEEFDSITGTTDFSDWDEKFWGPPYHWTCDWEAAQVRFIAVHASIYHTGEPGGGYDLEGFFHIPDAELTYLSDQLDALPEGWLAMICTHAPSNNEAFGNGIRATFPDDNGAELLTIIDENQEKIVACLNGHRHANSGISSGSGFWINGPAVSYTLGNPRGGFVLIVWDEETDDFTFLSRKGPPSNVYGPLNEAGNNVEIVRSGGR